MTSPVYKNFHVPAMWTPPEWLEWVDETFMHRKWHDPCPASWDGSSSGLDWMWCEYAYCNHPGSRGSAGVWWSHATKCMDAGTSLIWCAFNVEQLRHMKPSPFNLPGWLVMPRRRIGFIWGGPDTDKRKHGERATQPGNWTVFWSSVKPAPTPEPCVVVRTGTEGTK